MVYTLSSLIADASSSNNSNQSLQTVPQLAESLISEPECSEYPDGTCDPNCYGLTKISTPGFCQYEDSNGGKKWPSWNRYNCSDSLTCQSIGSKECCGDSRCMAYTHNTDTNQLTFSCKTKDSSSGACQSGGGNITNLTYDTGGKGTSTDITCINSGNGDTTKQCYTMYNCDNTVTNTSTPTMNKDYRFSSSTGGVTLYVDYNLKGNSVKFIPGTYTMSDMVAAGMPNDQVSSLYIPSGYNVQLFKNDNFNSLIGKFEGPRRVNLSGNNDQLSSFKVGSTLRCDTSKMITHQCGCQNCKLTAGNGPCDVETCSQACLDDPNCNYSFFNLNDGCQTFTSCDTSSYSGTGGQIYAKTTTTTSETPRNSSDCECTDSCFANSEGAYMSTSCDTECYGFKELEGNGYCTNSNIGGAGMSTTKYACTDTENGCIPYANMACCSDTRCKAYTNDSNSKEVTFYCDSLTSDDGPCSSAGTYSIPNMSITESPNSVENTNTNNCFDTVTNSTSDKYGKCFTKNDCTTQYNPTNIDCTCGPCLSKDEAGYVNCENSTTVDPLCSSCDNDYSKKYYCGGSGGYCATCGEEGTGQYKCKDTNTNCTPDCMLPVSGDQTCSLNMAGTYTATESTDCNCATFKFNITDDQKYEDCSSSGSNQIGDKIMNQTLSNCKQLACNYPDAKGFSFGTIDGTANTCVLRSSTDCSKTGKDDSVFYYKSDNVIESMQNIDNKRDYSIVWLILLLIIVALLIYRFLRK